ncbi:hypothetical protein ACFX2C_020721 [Malus domestica]
MAAIFFLFRLSIFFLSSTFTSPASSSSSSSPPSYPDGRSYRIDCGSLSVSIDSFNTTWLSEGLFTGGAISPVSEPLRFRQTHEKTLRYFPLSSSEKTATPSPICPPADTSSAHSPSPLPDDLARTGAYSDLFAFVADSNADVCFHSIANDAPVIGSLMLVRVDETSYDGVSIGQNYILVNYGRFSCGADPFGPGFTNDTDLFGPPAPILSPIRYHDKFDFQRRSSPELFPGQTVPIGGVCRGGRSHSVRITGGRGAGLLLAATFRGNRSGSDRGGAESVRHFNQRRMSLGLIYTRGWGASRRTRGVIE